MEATFLQYLAPKIVVIGDEKQVSPSCGRGIGPNSSCATWPTNTSPKTATRPRGKTPPAACSTKRSCASPAAASPSLKHRRCVPEYHRLLQQVSPTNPTRYYSSLPRSAVRSRPPRANQARPHHQRLRPRHQRQGQPRRGRRLGRELEKCLADPRYDGRPSASSPSSATPARPRRSRRHCSTSTA